MGYREYLDIIQYNDIKAQLRSLLNTCDRYAIESLGHNSIAYVKNDTHYLTWSNGLVSWSCEAIFTEINLGGVDEYNLINAVITEYFSALTCFSSPNFRPFTKLISDNSHDKTLTFTLLDKNDKRRLFKNYHQK